MHIGFWWGDLRGGDHLEDPGVDGRMKLIFFSRSGMGEWTGLIWLSIGTGECGKETSGNYLASWGTVSFSWRTLLHGVVSTMHLLCLENILLSQGCVVKSMASFKCRSTLIGVYSKFEETQMQFSTPIANSYSVHDMLRCLDLHQVCHIRKLCTRYKCEIFVRCHKISNNMRVIVTVYIVTCACHSSDA